MLKSQFPHCSKQLHYQYRTVVHIQQQSTRQCQSPLLSPAKRLLSLLFKLLVNYNTFFDYGLKSVPVVSIHRLKDGGFLLTEIL